MPKRSRMPSRLLVVDRDPRYAEWLCHHLEALCPDARVSSVDIQGLDRLEETLSERDCDVLMLAAPFGSSPEDPEALGIELLRQLREKSGSPPVIIVAEEGNELTAVRALQLGAVDYIPKRLMTPERLKTAVKIALRRIEKRVARRLAALAEEAEARARSAAEAQAAAEEAEAESPMPDPMPAPDFIPGYTIRALIGDSEKAAVYLATSSVLGHNIALKVSKTVRDEAAGRQFLEREYTAIVAIEDPAVVRIYDYGVHGGHEFIAMEYLPRGDLKARIHQRMTEEEALHYVEQIAMALQVVHGAGLLHRDLKPANVMLREDGNIALIDFGLARSLDGSTTQSTRTGVLRGSPYYMSPEQALGEPLDVRSDFYSLGVILYEMLTGRRPFSGSSAMDVLQQHVHSPMPPLPSAFTHLEPLLSTLLAKSRDERFAQALEVAEAAAAARRALESEPRPSVA
jgi:DNA-binding response OmpR family regulator